jgi:hypothetical protein
MYTRTDVRNVPFVCNLQAMSGLRLLSEDDADLKSLNGILARLADHRSIELGQVSGNANGLVWGATLFFFIWNRPLVISELLC